MANGLINSIRSIDAATKDRLKSGQGGTPDARGLAGTVRISSGVGSGIYRVGAPPWHLLQGRQLNQRRRSQHRARKEVHQPPFTQPGERYLAVPTAQQLRQHAIADAWQAVEAGGPYLQWCRRPRRVPMMPTQVGCARSGAGRLKRPAHYLSALLSPHIPFVPALVLRL